MKQDNTAVVQKSNQFNIFHKIFYDLPLLIGFAIIIGLCASPAKTTEMLQAITPALLSALENVIMYKNGIVPVIIGCYIFFKNRYHVFSFLGIYRMNTS